MAETTQLQLHEEQLPFLKSLKECFTNRSFIVFEVISFTVDLLHKSIIEAQAQSCKSQRSN